LAPQPETVSETSSDSHLSDSSHDSPCLSPVQQEFIPEFQECDVSELKSETDARYRNDPSQPPLCSCTETTVDDLIFMTVTLGLRHSLTWVAQVDIMKKIKTTFKNAKILLSKKTYPNRLNINPEKDTRYHIFCDKCEAYLGERGSAKVITCTTPDCSQHILVSKPSNFFVSLSIESQIQTFLKDDNFVIIY